MADPSGPGEQIGIKSAGVSAPAEQRRHDHSVDIDEPAVALTEPPEIRALVARGLIKGEQERRSVADLSRIKSLLEQRFQLRRFES